MLPGPQVMLPTAEHLCWYSCDLAPVKPAPRHLQNHNFGERAGDAGGGLWLEREGLLERKATAGTTRVARAEQGAGQVVSGPLGGDPSGPLAPFSIFWAGGG